MIRPSTWDSRALGMPAYELESITEASLSQAMQTPGHYTVRIPSLHSKQILHAHGFYYCDTLIQPYCNNINFRGFRDTSFQCRADTKLDELLPICHSAFSHDRFHKDFNISSAAADLRYDNWLRDLHTQHNVFGLFQQQQLAGFIAVADNRLVLHAVADSFRGRGLAKFLWTPVCDLLFTQGHVEITTSISASNLSILNLYTRLGFKFRESIDIYHRLTR